MSERSPRAEIIGAHLYVSGRVQGVGYRMATWRRATQLQLQGWVRNLADGRVEARVEGPRPQVTALIQWCRNGPPAAIVRDLEVDYETVTGLGDFQIIH